MRPRSGITAACALLLGVAATPALCGGAGGARAEGLAGITVLHVSTVMVASEWITVTEPAGWRGGDGLALLIAAGADMDGRRARLAAALLAQGVAVAELAIAPDLDDPARLAEDARHVLVELACRLGSVQAGLIAAGSEAVLGPPDGRGAIASVAQPGAPRVPVASAPQADR